MLKFFILIFAVHILSCCEKEPSKAELLIGKWCLQEQLSGTNEWVESDAFTITFTNDSRISIMYKNSSEKCESIYTFDESTMLLDAQENCAKYQIEAVDQNQLILFQQGREVLYKFKFRRC